ncbi:hypothetical protein DL766_005792 [Monosporascus sp. MC13-8B]|uniref:Uncharacterized protein n=1 Tax=Monosporascus cannonballus TaxID=155416 RepID=A0ABY0HJH6_9PEZI|nr:hypothetical protein DL763_006929 [Monosporascus cannonballus]RYO94910.1 hypothetical protein DL762_000344 [Monosporascus cannonballus]RYP28569.1 hypothetical protein DL766_005792 [Monosporascus sp. MC13-8B]
MPSFLTSFSLSFMRVGVDAFAECVFDSVKGWWRSGQFRLSVGHVLKAVSAAHSHRLSPAQPHPAGDTFVNFRVGARETLSLMRALDNLGTGTARSNNKSPHLPTRPRGPRVAMKPFRPSLTSLAPSEASPLRPVEVLQLCGDEASFEFITTLLSCI